MIAWTVAIVLYLLGVALASNYYHLVDTFLVAVKDPPLSPLTKKLHILLWPGVMVLYLVFGAQREIGGGNPEDG